MSSDKVNESALYGLRFAADKERLSLHGYKAEWIAEVVATHALAGAVHSGAVVDKAVHDAAVEKLTRRVKQFENYWAGAKVNADQQVQRVQSALSALKDRELATKLAEQVGVLLLPDEEGVA